MAFPRKGYNKKNEKKSNKHLMHTQKETPIKVPPIFLSVKF